MPPNFDGPRAILISSDTAETGQGNRWTCIERTSIEHNRIPHAISTDVCLYQCNLVEIGRDGRNRRLFIVSREAEQRIIGGLRIVTIKSPIDGIDVIISLKLSRYLNYFTIRYKLDNCKIGHLYKFHYDLSRIWSSFFNVKNISCSFFK